MVSFVSSNTHAIDDEALAVRIAVPLPVLSDVETTFIVDADEVAGAHFRRS